MNLSGSTSSICNTTAAHYYSLEVANFIIENVFTLDMPLYVIQDILNQQFLVGQQTVAIQSFCTFLSFLILSLHDISNAKL